MISESTVKELMESHRLALDARRRRLELVAASNEKLQVRIANYLENRTPERMHKLEEMPYPEFLQTIEWRRMSWLVLQFQKKCAHCGALAREVHHQTYKFGRLPLLHPEVLEAVCHQCHEVLHGA